MWWPEEQGGSLGKKLFINDQVVLSCFCWSWKWTEKIVYAIVLPNTKLSSIDLKYLLFVLVGKRGSFANCRFRSQAIKKHWREGSDLCIQGPLSACECQIVSVDGYSVCVAATKASNSVLLSLQGEWTAEDRVKHNTARSGVEWGCCWDLHQCCPHHVAGSTEWLVGSLWAGRSLCHLHCLGSTFSCLHTFSSCLDSGVGFHCSLLFWALRSS